MVQHKQYGWHYKSKKELKPCICGCNTLHCLKQNNCYKCQTEHISPMLTATILSQSAHHNLPTYNMLKFTAALLCFPVLTPCSPQSIIPTLCFQPSHTMNPPQLIIGQSQNPERYTNLHSKMLFLLICEKIRKGKQLCRLPNTVTSIKTGCGIETSGSREDPVAGSTKQRHESAGSILSRHVLNQWPYVLGLHIK